MFAQGSTVRPWAKVFFYILATDRPSCCMGRADFDETRALPKISTAAKLPGILPVYIGVEMILAESYLPPRVARWVPGEVAHVELIPQEAQLH
jgi:hypothetical protein